MRNSILFGILFLLAVFCADVGNACRSKSADESERSTKKTAVEPTTSASVQQNDEEDDETEEDASVTDVEDFDLICDDHVAPNRTKRLPDIIIIGARKGGTRALLEFLKIHPVVKSAGPEVHYFDRHFDKGPEWYVEQMVAVTEEQLCAEKTPGYFHHPEAPARARSQVPDAKLLLIVRDPVRRALSDYNQFRTRNLDRGRDYPTFESLILTEDGRVDAAYPPLQRSIYHQHLSKWLDSYSKDQIHVVDGDKFITSPWTELALVENFLEVPPVIQEDNFYFNATKGFYCSRQMRSKGVWECTMKKCLSKSKGRPKPKVDAGVLDKLAEFFRPHNKVFSQLAGRDFEWAV